MEIKARHVLKTDKEFWKEIRILSIMEQKKLNDLLLELIKRGMEAKNNERNNPTEKQP